MRINRSNALRLWENHYGDRDFAEDFHGNLMYRDAIGKTNFCIRYNGQKIHCGWNLHHILPKHCGGTNSINNLICTNIITNQIASDRITFWIENSLYQVKKDPRSCKYNIVEL